MSFHIKDDFNPRGPVSQVSAGWFNRVAKFLNGLVAGFGLQIQKNDNGIVEISLDFSKFSFASFGRQVTQANTHGTQLVPDFEPSSVVGGEPQIDKAGWEPYPDLTGDDDEKTPVGWERGKTAYKNGNVVDAEHPAVGGSFTFCSHRHYRTINGVHYYQDYFSRVDFDENGLIVRVVPCVHTFTDNV